MVRQGMTELHDLRCHLCLSNELFRRLWFARSGGTHLFLCLFLHAFQQISGVLRGIYDGPRLSRIEGVPPASGAPWACAPAAQGGSALARRLKLVFFVPFACRLSTLRQKKGVSRLPLGHVGLTCGDPSCLSTCCAITRFLHLHTFLQTVCGGSIQSPTQ